MGGVKRQFMTRNNSVAIHMNFLLLLLGMAAWKYFLYFGRPTAEIGFTSLRASATISHLIIWALAYYYCFQTDGKGLLWLKGNVSVLFSLFTYVIVGWIGVYMMYRTYGRLKKLESVADTPLEKLPVQERKSVFKSMFPQSTMEASPLFYAVMADDEAEVILLSKNKSGLNKTDFMNLTPLHYAAHGGNTRLVKILLDNGADPGAGEHALIGAVEGGNKETVDEFLKRSLDVNLTSPQGETLLMIAISYDHPDLASFLIERGADINVKNSSGATALFYAARNLQVETVRTLLEKGSPAAVKNNAGITPLLLAFRNDAYEFSSKAEDDAESDKGRDKGKREAAREQIVGMLLKKGADPNVGNQHRESVLSLAVETGNEKIVALLIRHGVDVNMHVEELPGPLEPAMEANNQTIAKMLLAAGAMPPESGTNEGPDKIDIIATGKDGALELVIVDAGLITDPAKRLETLHNRLAACIQYVDSDGFREKQNSGRHNRCRIKVVSPVPPTDEMQKVSMVMPKGKPAGGIPVVFEQLPNSPFKG
jgi:ankyrin repeat protein